MSRVGPAFIPSMASMQCPGRNGVFIRGMKPWNSSGAFWGTAGPAFFFSLRGSPGFRAFSGMAQEPPKRSAPGMRPSAQYWLMRR